jgi:hypothetical protein
MKGCRAFRTRWFVAFALFWLLGCFPTGLLAHCQGSGSGGTIPCNGDDLDLSQVRTTHYGYPGDKDNGLRAHGDQPLQRGDIALGACVRDALGASFGDKICVRFSDGSMHTFAYHDIPGFGDRIDIYDPDKTYGDQGYTSVAKCSLNQGTLMGDGN